MTVDRNDDVDVTSSLIRSLFSGNKSKNSVAVQSAGKLVTKKRHADKNLIPDHIISTAVDDSEEETMMQRLQNGKRRAASFSGLVFITRRQSNRSKVFSRKALLI